MLEKSVAQTEPSTDWLQIIHEEVIQERKTFKADYEKSLDQEKKIIKK